MASGEDHIKGTLILGLGLGGLTMLGSGDWQAGLFVLGGTWAGIFLTPDLDQAWVINKGEQTIIRYTLGLGYIWLAIWHLYATLIPHRSPLSHWPVVGTAGRLLWLYIVYLGIYLVWGVPADSLLGRWVLWGQAQPDAYWYAALVGLALSDSLHFAMDIWPARRG